MDELSRDPNKYGEVTVQGMGDSLPPYMIHCSFCNKPIQGAQPIPFRPGEALLSQQVREFTREDNEEDLEEEMEEQVTGVQPVESVEQTSGAIPAASEELADGFQNAAQDPSSETPSEQPIEEEAGTGMPMMEIPQQLPVQEAFFENIMRLNQGKMVDVHMNFDSSAMTKEVFSGIILAGGRDNIVLQNPATGEVYVLLTVFLNYVLFHEEINFNPELAFGSGGGVIVRPT